MFFLVFDVVIFVVLTFSPQMYKCAQNLFDREFDNLILKTSTLTNVGLNKQRDCFQTKGKQKKIVKRQFVLEIESERVRKYFHTSSALSDLKSRTLKDSKWGGELFVINLCSLYLLNSLPFFSICFFFLFLYELCRVILRLWVHQCLWSLQKNRNEKHLLKVLLWTCDNDQFADRYR